MPKVHLLTGLEPDNLLAFLALVGFHRCLAHARPQWSPRVYWGGVPMRPTMILAHEVERPELLDTAAKAASELAEVHSFGRPNLDYSAQEAREEFKHAGSNRMRLDLLSALMSDAAVREDRIRATPFCAMFGQGHQNFLDRLGSVPKATLDPGQSYQAQKQTTQTLDQYGNLTQMQVFNFGNLSTPARTYTNNYLNSSNYTSRYIFNRLTSSTVTDGTNSATLVSNSYDGTSLTNVTGMNEHDSNYGTSATYRGNVTGSTTPTASTSHWYDIGGNVTKTTVNGVTTTTTISSTTNYAAPDQMTTNSQSASTTWTSALGVC